jgi:hypothetical protein
MREDADARGVLDALAADARGKEKWRLGHDRRVREETSDDAARRETACDSIRCVANGVTDETSSRS